ncbi:hypothetical protein DL96DRAFT_1652310 [Flagelloscypha sp. PMI_526]|nr:hypothetical protein DL96DRAFT_1652310 [Flagelloscypha sp. PMI_526]
MSLSSIGTLLQLCHSAVGNVIGRLTHRITSSEGATENSKIRDCIALRMALRPPAFRLNFVSTESITKNTKFSAYMRSCQGKSAT